MRTEAAPRLPPRWFVRTFWAIHRGLCRVTGARFGLRSATAGRWGMLRLETVGRHSGETRAVILGYLEDDENLVVLAMNGWADGPPAWWLNLQERPDASVDLSDGSRQVRARTADSHERSRLWAKWVAVDASIDAHAAARTRETPVVVLEPRRGR